MGSERPADLELALIWAAPGSGVRACIEATRPARAPAVQRFAHARPHLLEDEDVRRASSHRASLDDQAVAPTRETSDGARTLARAMCVDARSDPKPRVFTDGAGSPPASQARGNREPSAEWLGRLRPLSATGYVVSRCRLSAMRRKVGFRISKLCSSPQHEISHPVSPATA